MSRNVIIAEDIQHTRQTMNRILTENHFTVVGEARDGKEAADLYRRLKPDIITMDLVMPRVSGVEASRKILGEFPGARIIIITGMELEQVANELISVGVRDYIYKPIIPIQLIRSVESVMTSDMKLNEKLKKGGR